MSDKLAKYQTVTEEDLAQVDREADSIGGSSILKLAEGDNVLRILPAPVGGWKTFRTTARHTIDPMPGLDKKLFFNCPKFELKEDCPVCDHATRLLGGKNPVDQELGKKLRAKSAVLCNVCNRDNTDAGARVLYMNAGGNKSLWAKVNSLFRSRSGGPGMVDPSEAGYDTIIHRKGTGQFDTEYNVFPSRDSTPLSEDQDESDRILSSQIDLETLIDITVPMELLEAFGRVASSNRVATAATRRSAVTDARRAAPSAPKLPPGGKAYDPNDESTW
jgi:hypothetical protein